MSLCEANGLEPVAVANGVSGEVIQEVLAIYRPEHRYVVEAEFHEPALLACSLRATRYPYTTDEVFKYITAPTANLFACQMAYVLVGAISLRRCAAMSAIGVRGWEHFLSLRNHASFRFGEFSIRFRREVANIAPICGCVSIERPRRFGAGVHCMMPFRIGDGITGTIRAVLVD